MTNRTHLRMISAVLMMGALSACQTTTPVSDPVMTGRAISPTELLSSFMAANPDADGVPLLNRRGGGFVIHNDDTVTFHVTSRLKYRSAVTSIDGNEICMAPDGKWEGACVELTLLQDNTVSFKYRYNNGRSGTSVSSPLNL